MRSTVLFAALAMAAPALAATPAGGPTEAQVKSCLQQLDVGNKWKFDWQEVVVGQARKPLNSYESMTLIGRPADPDFTGYPVRAKYKVADHAVDAAYWFYRDDQGNWQVPFLCMTK